MSKKPKQSRHRVPVLPTCSDPITPEYQAEIDQSMERLQHRYQKAQKALEVAEAKAERKRQLAEHLAQKQAEAKLVAQTRMAEEQRLTEYVERIKDAAKAARQAEARADLERKQREVTALRNAETARRKFEAKERLDRERQIVAARNGFRSLEVEVAERRRELREIERLMMPGNYAGRDHRKHAAAHTAGTRA